MRKLLCLLPWIAFQDVHLVKDVGLFPEYFGIEYDMPVDFVFLGNKNGTKLDNYHGMNLKKLMPTKEYESAPCVSRNPIAFFRFIKLFTDFLGEHKNSYSHIMMFHITGTTLYLLKFIKRMNKTLKVYIKADAASLSKRSWFCAKKILRACDALSVESESLFEEMKKTFPKYTKKTAYIPNGFDDKNFDKKLLTLPKEKVIIQTARFGTAQKNTPLLLKILSETDLKDWKVILAGSIEKDFGPHIADFFEKHPDQKERVSFIGNISDRDTLYRLYGHARIFILTSRWESFCLSLMEAAYFGDYIISTDVGIASTIRNKFGGFVSDGNPLACKNDKSIAAQIENELQKCVDNPARCELGEEMKRKIRGDFSMSTIVRAEIFKRFFGGC